MVKLPTDKEKTRAQVMARRVAHNPSKCSKCGRKAGQWPQKNGLHRHHDDYSKPTDIIMLCPSCHATVHANQAWAKRYPEVLRDIKAGMPQHASQYVR